MVQSENIIVAGSYYTDETLLYYFTAADALIEACHSAHLKVDKVKSFAESHSRAKKNPGNRMDWSIYNTNYQSIQSDLHNLNITLNQKVDSLEREFYKNHHKMSTKPTDNRLLQQISAVNYYLQPIKRYK